jgi:hypothetical protein
MFGGLLLVSFFIFMRFWQRSWVKKTNVVLDGIPENIDGVLLIDEPVMHAGYLRPWNLWMVFSALHQKTIGCLSAHFDKLGPSQLKHFEFVKLSSLATLRHVDGLARIIPHVKQANLRVIPRHTESPPRPGPVRECIG